MSDQTFLFHGRQGLYTFHSLELGTKDPWKSMTHELTLGVGEGQESHSQFPSLENPSSS